MYDQFSTVCPNCGQDGTLWVVQVTFDGSEYDVSARLCADGFDVADVFGDRQVDLEDERVQCDACSHFFDLADLML